MSIAQKSRAIVLLSGGLDSTTVLAVAKHQGYEIYALSFRYGQRHAIELACAARQAQRFAVERHEIVDLSSLGRLVAPATALMAESKNQVPKGRDVTAATDIPMTYVPARNTLFLSYALAWAEAVDATSLWIGINALDYSGYPDCRPEFLQAFTKLANLATRAGIEGPGFQIQAPLLHLRKDEIIRLGFSYGVEYQDTVSCYDPCCENERIFACGQCDSCQLRRQGFLQANIPDPTFYVKA